MVAQIAPVAGRPAESPIFSLRLWHACKSAFKRPETPSGALEERKLGVSSTHIAHDHLGRAERRLESAVLICALLQLFSWVSGRLNALMHACQSLSEKMGDSAGPPATGAI